MASYTHTPPTQSPRTQHHPIAKPNIFLPQLPDPDHLHSSSPRKRQRTQQQPVPNQQQNVTARSALPNQAQQPQQNVASPSPGPVNSTGLQLGLASTSNGGIPTLRVMEEGGTETFALPLTIIDGPEALIPILRQTFGQRDGTPKIKTANGDTVPKVLLKHFLKDGVLLVISFPPLAVPQPSTAATQHQRIGSQNSLANANASRPNNANTVNVNTVNNANNLNNASNSNNPPTPYSPPSPSTSASNALPSLYPASAQIHPHNHIAHHVVQQQQQLQQQVVQQQQQQHHHHHAQPSPRLPTPSPSTSTVTNQQSNSPSTANSSTPAVYKLSRQLKTVADLWREWTIGLPPNFPSVQSLEEKHGPKWRTSQAERKFYSRRKVIIDEVKKLIEVQGRKEIEAIAEVENWRDGRSLDALSKGINERRRKETAAAGNDMTRLNVAAEW